MQTGWLYYWKHTPTSHCPPDSQTDRHKSKLESTPYPPPPHPLPCPPKAKRFCLPKADTTASPCLPQADTAPSPCLPKAETAPCLPKADSAPSPCLPKADITQGRYSPMSSQGRYSPCLPKADTSPCLPKADTVILRSWHFCRRQYLGDCLMLTAEARPKANQQVRSWLGEFLMQRRKNGPFLISKVMRVTRPKAKLGCVLTRGHS